MATPRVQALLQHTDSNPRGWVCKVRVWVIAACFILSQVADLGLARRLSGMSGRQFSSTVGTPHYQAPEVLIEGCLSSAGDVYSFGYLVWELVHGEPPFAGLGVAQVLYQVALRGVRPSLEDCPAALADLIRSCWQQDAAARCVDVCSDRRPSRV